jgi:hypothetical protein
MRLERERALVTGSSRGGKGIVVTFACEGADVIINYVGKADEAERIRAEAVKTGRRVGVAQADVSLRARFLEMTESGYRAVIAVDMTGPSSSRIPLFVICRRANRPRPNYQHQLRARTDAVPALHVVFHGQRRA